MIVKIIRIFAVKPLVVLKLLFIILLFSGCRAALVRMMGIKAPRIENPQSIKEFLVSNNKSVENVYFINGEKDSAQKMMMVLNDWMKAKLRFYNRSGELLVEKDPDDCAGVKFRTFLDSLETAYQLDQPGTAQLPGDLKLMRTLDSGEVILSQLPQADYYVIATWAKFLGKRNYKETIDWYESEIHSRPKKIVLIKLNMDLMESWGLGKLGDKIGMRMGKG